MSMEGNKDMTIRTEKAYEHAREILATVRDINLDACEKEAKYLDRKLQTDRNVSNEARARLVCDAFCDLAEVFDLDGFDAFLDRFPELAAVL